jgi:phosphatidylserine/phosphatidylglycerophosphate/cardiolipin synthase-like enzyme
MSMRTAHRMLSRVIALAFVCGLLVFFSNSPASAIDSYTPPSGVRLNNPLGDRAHRQVILRHLLRTINSTPRGSLIRIATWNLRSKAAVDALLAAHRRGVSVRVVIDRGNANPDNPNPGFDRLQRGLQYNQAHRRSWMTSWAFACASACRAPGGIAHTKFYLFSHAGTAHDVVMYGSANLTDLAAGFQWNDLFTLRDRPALYTWMLKIFQEMALDAPQSQPYRVQQFPGLRMQILPWKGSGTEGDPILNELNKVRCTGATGRAGSHGHTLVRIAMTAMLGDRGVSIANRLHVMWNRGCEVKVVYAVMGNEVLAAMRSRAGRGPVPMHQIVQDFDQDGVYDRYLHTKVLAVSGVYNGNSHAWVTFNGSSNWTAVSLDSDETLGRVEGSGPYLKYAAFVNYWYSHVPGHAAYSSSGGSEFRTATVDPFAKVQLD